MGRRVLHSAFRCAALLLCAWVGGTADQNAAVQSAAAAMQRGDYAAAEKTLRAEVGIHPGDSWALSLLGVALDNQKKPAEAEEFHRRAVAAAPRSAEILNNYGTHQWNAGQFDKAEISFASALAAAPTYFNVLYNLGVMATYTGHYERAHEVLESALRQQPQNLDVLYRLACVEEASKQWEAAVTRLAQAAKLDPRRADVQKLLALTATELGALDDAAAAWDRYLKMEPDDQVARRERAYVGAKMGKVEEGIAGLEGYLAQYPDDAVGHFELGQARRSVDVAQALGHLDRALAIDPNYLAARMARGGLYYQEGRPEAAVGDLEFAASRQPDNAENLDRLGQTYQALERTADAVRVFRRAAELAPEDSKTLLHFGRALADAGQTEESKVVMERFRQLGPEQKNIVPGGLVEYLSLTPAQRHADYRARVDKAVRDHPEDAAAQATYLKALIEDGKADEVAATARRLAKLGPGAAVLAESGRALLGANYYAPARDLLQQAVSAGASGARVDLAVATFRALGAAPGAIAGLALMDRIPEAERGAGYYLARAQMLDASGKVTEAGAALERELRVAPGQPDSYRQAVALLVREGRAAEALRVAEEAARGLPENREMLLLKAISLEFGRRSDAAGKLLMEIRNRWPEWPAVWLTHGIVLNSHQRYEEARQALAMAVELGAQSPETYFYLADSELHGGAARKDAAEAAIREALKLSPGDPWIQSLAGRIAFARGDYPLAVERQRAAVGVRPQFIEAHQQLAQAYGASDRKQEAERELEKVRSLREGLPGAGGEDAPPYLGRLFEGRL
jgi:tetratricopeptide (TPR) repeat protein